MKTKLNFYKSLIKPSFSPKINIKSINKFSQFKYSNLSENRNNQYQKSYNIERNTVKNKESNNSYNDRNRNMDLAPEFKQNFHNKNSAEDTKKFELIISIRMQLINQIREQISEENFSLIKSTIGKSGQDNKAINIVESIIKKENSLGMYYELVRTLNKTEYAKSPTRMPASIFNNENPDAAYYLLLLLIFNHSKRHLTDSLLKIPNFVNNLKIGILNHSILLNILEISRIHTKVSENLYYLDLQTLKILENNIIFNFRSNYCLPKNLFHFPYTNFSQNKEYNAELLDILYRMIENNEISSNNIDQIDMNKFINCTKQFLTNNYSPSTVEKYISIITRLIEDNFIKRNAKDKIFVFQIFKDIISIKSNGEINSKLKLNLINAILTYSILNIKINLLKSNLTIISDDNMKIVNTLYVIKSPYFPLMQKHEVSLIEVVRQRITDFNETIKDKEVNTVLLTSILCNNETFYKIRDYYLQKVFLEIYKSIKLGTVENNTFNDHLNVLNKIIVYYLDNNGYYTQPNVILLMRSLRNEFSINNIL